MTETITVSHKPVCLLQFTERVLDWSQEIWILLLALKLVRYVTSSILLNLTGFFFFKNYGNRLCDLWEWWELYIELQIETTDNMMWFFFLGVRSIFCTLKYWHIWSPWDQCLKLENIQENVWDQENLWKLGTWSYCINKITL